MEAVALLSARQEPRTPDIKQVDRVNYRFCRMFDPRQVLYSDSRV
jgi:hypothetical protein